MPGSPVSGTISWFGGPNDPGAQGTPASGIPITTPGISLYNHATLGGWWLVTMPNGKQAALQQTDIGPAPWTGRTFDFTYSALPHLGYSEQNFPTNARISGTYLGRSLPAQYRSLAVAMGGQPGNSSSSLPTATSTASSGTGAPSTSNVLDQAAYQQAKDRSIVGNFLKGSPNPFNIGPKVPGMSNSNPLFTSGLLTTTAPNPADYMTAQTDLQKLAGNTIVSAHPVTQAATGTMSNLAGGFLPKGAMYIVGRKDQGRDGQTNPGGAILAPGNGYVVRIGSDPKGFGPAYPIVHFTSGPFAGRTMYIGHTLATITSGSFTAGQVLSHTGTHGVGNASVPGWFEIGYADGGSPGAMGQPVPF